MPDTPHGFTYGPLEITRLAHDDRLGYVVEVRCGNEHVMVRCSPQGRRLSATISQNVNVYPADRRTP